MHGLARRFRIGLTYENEGCKGEIVSVARILVYDRRRSEKVWKRKQGYDLRRTMDIIKNTLIDNEGYERLDQHGRMKCGKDIKVKWKQIWKQKF